jgi:hypothetical protein
MNIQTICDGITKAIDAVRVPFTYIPAIILVCSAVKRPGLSAMIIASNIIKRQSEAGAPSGSAADGSANVAEAMERIRVEEMVRALKMDARIQIGIPIGGIQITGTGGNAGGPVQITGFNINAPHGDGVLN